VIPLVYSWVAGAKSASLPERRHEPFEDFCRSLETPELRHVKDGPAIILSTFGDRANDAGNFRHDANVMAITGWAVDLDSGSSEAEIRAALGEHLFIAHTTYSHTAKTPKYRAIVPFLSPVGAEHARALFEYFNSLFRGRLDPTCKNASRLYYLPACPPDRAELFRCFTGGRLPMDVPAVLV
jgi:hypothetical protein